MMVKSAWVAGFTIVGLLLLNRADAEAPWPRLDPDGTIHAEQVAIPLSNFLSPEAKAYLIRQHLQDQQDPAPDYATEGAEKRRAYSVRFHQPNNDKWRAIFPSDISRETIGGVPVDVIIPKSGIAPENAGRVLINIHGGGFYTGAVHIGQNNSIPVAGVGRIKVITVDYRMAPEFTFPAGSEDIEKVYLELLKTYRPENVGIYGCSAGGILAGQTIALLQKTPEADAGRCRRILLGITARLAYGGDSTSLFWLLNGQRPPSPTKAPPANAPRGYFDGIDMKDPLVTPALSADVLAKFPPTLMLSGTRDFAMSNVISTHLKLLEAGVDAQLIIAEGLGHEQYVYAGTPEAIRINTQIWRFFDRHLGH